MLRSRSVEQLCDDLDTLSAWFEQFGRAVEAEEADRDTSDSASERRL